MTSGPRAVDRRHAITSNGDLHTSSSQAGDVKETTFYRGARRDRGEKPWILVSARSAVSAVEDFTALQP